MADKYKFATTSVFWDADDFRVPPGRCVESFRNNITQALKTAGYIGDLIMTADGSKNMPKALVMHMWKEGITIRSADETKRVRLMGMLMTMISLLSTRKKLHCGDKFIFLVIVKDIPEGDTEFFNVLEALIKYKCKVFLVVPDNCPPEEVPPPNIASLVWRWTDLFDGGPPIKRDSDPREDRDADSDDDDFHFPCCFDFPDHPDKEDHFSHSDEDVSDSDEDDAEF